VLGKVKAWIADRKRSLSRSQTPKRHNSKGAGEKACGSRAQGQENASANTEGETSKAGARSKAHGQERGLKEADKENKAAGGKKGRVAGSPHRLKANEVHSKPSTLNPQPSTPNPQPQTLNPKPVRFTAQYATDRYKASAPDATDQASVLTFSPQVDAAGVGRDNAETFGEMFNTTAAKGFLAEEMFAVSPEPLNLSSLLLSSLELSDTKVYEP